MQKKAFTLMEMIIVVIILSMVFVAAKNFFDTSYQEKVAFGERCVNKIFWDIGKFETDALYGNANATKINQYDATSVTLNLWRLTWVNLGGTRVFGMITLESYNDPMAVWKSTNISLAYDDSSNGFVRKDPCRSVKYIVGMVRDPITPSTWSSLEIELLSWENISIYDNRSTRLTGWGVIFNVCELTSVSTSTAGASQWRSCLQIWRLIADIRLPKLIYQKCYQINQTNWGCTSRPTY